ncbi:hypothetical protein MKX01_038665 [Papaver californicum]|nr:hypothetical protein MKX01_038665 [Papaver californicum]
MGFASALGWDNGIVLAPLGADVTGPQLVAAVANAGGVGFLAGASNNYDMQVKSIKATKKLTSKPFGVGVLLEWDQSNSVRAIFDEKLACMQVFWGDYPKELVDEAHKNGVQVVHQVGSVAEAEKAISACVDCIMAQSFEAGGHIRGSVSVIALVPRIVDLIGDKKVTVIATGAIADPRGFVAALALGASGIAMGTRFIATPESYANHYYKQQLLHYTEADTDYTDLYSRASTDSLPQGVSNNDEQPIIGYSIIHENILKTFLFLILIKFNETILRRFAGQVANQITAGELDQMVMYGGQGVGLVHEILHAGHGPGGC